MKHRMEPCTVGLQNYGSGKLNLIWQIPTVLSRSGHEVCAVVQVQKDIPVGLLIRTDTLPQLGFALVIDMQQCELVVTHTHCTFRVSSWPPPLIAHPSAPRTLTTLTSLCCQNFQPTRESAHTPCHSPHWDHRLSNLSPSQTSGTRPALCSQARVRTHAPAWYHSTLIQHLVVAPTHSAQEDCWWLASFIIITFVTHSELVCSFSHVGKKVCKGGLIRRSRSPCSSIWGFSFWGIIYKGVCIWDSKGRIQKQEEDFCGCSKVGNSCQPTSTATTGVLQCAGRYLWLSFTHALSTHTISGGAYNDYVRLLIAATPVLQAAVKSTKVT